MAMKADSISLMICCYPRLGRGYRDRTNGSKTDTGFTEIT